MNYDKINKNIIFNENALDVLDYMIEKGKTVDMIFTDPPYKEEVINNWVENVKTLYGVTINPKYNAKSDSYYDYYGIYMNELILNVYGDVEPYNIENCFREHNN